MEVIQYSLQDAINHIIDSGVTPTELSHELGFQDTSMVYRYKNGKTKTTSAVRAKVLFDKYGILLDDFISAEHLEQKAQAELNRGIKEVDSCGHIFDKLLVIASYKGADLRQRLLKFIAEMDKRC